HQPRTVSGFASPDHLSVALHYGSIAAKGEVLGVKLQRGGPHHQNERDDAKSRSSSDDRMPGLSSLFSELFRLRN
ncbi:MAG: hypothetical protein EBY57_12065, partial [Actinobacteria bacterium]|nr:hypothetical protein [Actinomycetota bacterium]